MPRAVKRNILLVEDDSLLAMTQKTHLERYGYTVTTVTTGERAVEVVRTSSDIDLILMDIDLGNGLDGTQAAEMILQELDVPIVFLSSHTEPEMVEKTEKIASYGYVVKNSSIAVLDASIKMAFKLFESHRLADNTFTHAINGFCVHRVIRDNSGKIHDCEYLRVNDAFERQTGLSSHKLLGRTIRELYPEPDAEEVIRLYESVLSGHADARQEFYFRPTESWFEMNIFGIQEDEFTVVVHNVTERKQAEEELNRFRTISDTAVYGKAISDLQGNLLYVNRFFATIHGYEPDELVGAHLSVFHNEQQLDVVNDLTATLFRDGNFQSTKVWHCHRDGTEFPMFMNGVLLKDGTGRPQYMAVSAVDMTERERLVGELRKEHELTTRIIEDGPVAITQVDRDGKIVFANSHAQRLLGLTENAMGDLRYNSPEWRITDLDGSPFPEERLPFRQVLSTGQAVYDVQHAIHKPGSRKALSINGAPLHDEHGRIDRVVFAIEDITERKRAEDELHTVSKMQSIILRMASDYIDVSQELVDETIERSLKELGEFVQADRAYVFEYDWVKDVANNTHEWCNDGVNPEKDNLQGVPNTVIHYWAEAHRRGKDMCIEDVMQLPFDDGVRHVLEPQGVKSVLALPMMRQGECIGFVGFDSVKETRTFSVSEKTLLRVFSEMLVNIGHRQELEKALVHAKERAEENSADLTAIIEGATESIWAFDENYKIRYINDEFRNDFLAAFGVQLETGSNLIDALPEALRPVWKSRYDRVLSNQQFVITDEVETQNGKRYIYVSFNPIVQAGQVIGGSCFASDITDRTIAKMEIEKQLNEKETLLREVHHRVKNNMATIESLLSLQVGSTVHAEVKAALQDTISRVQSSRVLYDKLLVSDNLNEVSIEPYANSLIDAIVAVFDVENAITIERHIADFEFSPQKAFFLGIIINELLTNVFKYAFKGRDEGTVSVSIGTEERTVTLCIHDNGVGFDERTLKNESIGFGITVVTMLVEQLGGTFSQSNDNWARSVVRFEL